MVEQITREWQREFCPMITNPGVNERRLQVAAVPLLDPEHVRAEKVRLSSPVQNLAMMYITGSTTKTFQGEARSCAQAPCGHGTAC